MWLNTELSRGWGEGCWLCGGCQAHPSPAPQCPCNPLLNFHQLASSCLIVQPLKVFAFCHCVSCQCRRYLPFLHLGFSPVWVWQGYAGAYVSYIPSSEMFDYTIKQVNIELPFYLPALLCMWLWPLLTFIGIWLFVTLPAEFCTLFQITNKYHIKCRMTQTIC